MELALSLPLLLMMFLTVVETGRAFYIAISVANAARAGVQYGSQNLTTAADTAGMQSAATADAPGLSGMTATARYYCICSDGTASTCLATDCAGSHRLAVHAGQHQRVVRAADQLHGDTADDDGAGQSDYAGPAIVR